MVYLNHAGTTWPKPPQVREAVAAALESTPNPELFESARSDVCRFLGLPSPDRFLFTAGCTSALGAAIGDLPWEDGDVVVTSALEHHALIRPVQQLAHRGVEHVVAPRRSGTPIDFDFVRDTLTRGNVRLVAVTHASNVTGELLPVADLARLAHEHDALFLLDAAQTVGVVDVDVRAIGADILVFAGHKGPLGPQGIGGLWAAAPVAFSSPGAVCQIGQPQGCMPGYCDLGSVNLAAAAGLAAGFRFIEERGLDATGGHACRLAAELRERLDDRCTVYGAGPSTAAVSLSIDGLPLERAEAHFLEHGIVVRAGQHCSPMACQAIGAPAGTLRISFGAMNAREDLFAVLRAVEFNHTA